MIGREGRSSQHRLNVLVVWQSLFL